MKVIAPDFERTIEMPGLPGPTRKPVDVDTVATGFTRLRSLRLYRFDQSAVIDGHAEEDEVFVVVTEGSVEIKIGWEGSAVDAAGTYMLTAPGEGSTAVKEFVAYLPPHSVYQLTPHTGADVVYARATPTEVRSPAVFGSVCSQVSVGVSMLLDERTHAQRLRLRVLRVEARSSGVDLDPLGAADSNSEAFVLVLPAGKEAGGEVEYTASEPRSIKPWETLALTADDRPAFSAVQCPSLLVVAVLAA